MYFRQCTEYNYGDYHAHVKNDGRRGRRPHMPTVKAAPTAIYVIGMPYQDSNKTAFLRRLVRLKVKLMVHTYMYIYSLNSRYVR